MARGVEAAGITPEKREFEHGLGSQLAGQGPRSLAYAAVYVINHAVQGSCLRLILGVVVRTAAGEGWMRSWRLSKRQSACDSDDVVRGRQGAWRGKCSMEKTSLQPMRQTKPQ